MIWGGIYDKLPIFFMEFDNSENCFRTVKDNAFCTFNKYLGLFKFTALGTTRRPQKSGTFS